MQIFHLSPVDPIGDMSDILKKRIVSRAKTQSSTLLLLSGGSWVKVYDAITELPEDVDYTRISIGLVDERWVPRDHVDRNESRIKKTQLVSLLELKGAQFISMIEDLETGEKSNVERISNIYASLKSDGKYILCTMGIGDDGHIAGILPTVTKSVFDTRFREGSSVVYYEATPEETTNPFLQRMTITPEYICLADEVVVYACGTQKKQVIARLGEVDIQEHRFPAKIITELGKRATLYSDQVISSLSSHAQPDP